MISGGTSCFLNVPQGLQPYSISDAVLTSSLEASTNPETHFSSLLYSLSALKDKVRQVESQVSIIISPDQSQLESTSIAIANMGILIPEIIVSASSLMFTCQQMALGSTQGNTSTDELHQQHVKLSNNGFSQAKYCGSNSLCNIGQERGQGFSSNETLEWYADNHHNSCTNNDSNQSTHLSNSHEVNDRTLPQGDELHNGLMKGLSPKDYDDVIEFDATVLLAKYTHYCQVCGKGFKRDANLRMHMRAHGDEYKTSAALSNPMKKNGGATECLMKDFRKYSCPQEGCRWNQKHAKFQPLKSMICVKNHYKRSHCPKMYVCNRCNQKQFSVVSDLRTHEKHCGDLKWQCSCGTTFSRKDKLMGHVALFVGHTPAAQLRLDNRG